MRDNLYNEDDPRLITKKFWSHVKSNSKSSRLPETMHLDDTFRNKPSEKAELFNNYFYEQFSGRPNYNTHIDFSNDQVFDIDFNRNRVHKYLSNINSNKVCGPDGIHGKILKNCSFTHFKSLLQHWKSTKGMEAGKCRSNSQKRRQG